MHVKDCGIQLFFQKHREACKYTLIWTNHMCVAFDSFQHKARRLQSFTSMLDILIMSNNSTLLLEFRHLRSGGKKDGAIY